MYSIFSYLFCKFKINITIISVYCALLSNSVRTRWVALMIQLGKFAGGGGMVADTNYLYHFFIPQEIHSDYWAGL